MNISSYYGIEIRTSLNLKACLYQSTIMIEGYPNLFDKNPKALEVKVKKYLLDLKNGIKPSF